MGLAGARRFGRYYRVLSRFWQDEKVAEWNDDARLLALYLLTCPHRNIVGYYYLPLPYIQADLKWSPERLAEPFARLLRDGFIEYDSNRSVVLIANALKYDPPDNPNQVIACVNAVSEVPSSQLLRRLITVAEQYAQPLAKRLRERFAKQLAEPLGEPLPQPLAEPFAQPDSDTNTDTLTTQSPSLRSGDCAPHGALAFGDSPSEPALTGEQPEVDAHELTETNSSPPVRLTVRAAMAPVLEYLLEKTGRTRESVTQAEADATFYLDERHTPLAVKSQINQLAKRFQKAGRPLSDLTLDYVWESMRYWKPTRPGGRAPMPRDPPRDPLLDKLREDGDSA